MPTWLDSHFTFHPRRLQAAMQTDLDVPAWRPRWPKGHPRRAQDTPRAAKELPQGRPGSDPQAAWGEDTPQSGPRLRIDFDFVPLWQRFGRYFAIFWIDFGKDFGKLSGGFWKDFV